jgi:hypothetical protein
LPGFVDEDELVQMGVASRFPFADKLGNLSSTDRMCMPRPVDAHAQIASAEVTGDGLGGGQFGEVVVAFGEVVREGVGLLGEFELGGVEKVLLSRWRTSRLCMKSPMAYDEDQYRDEAFAVSLVQGRVVGHGVGQSRPGMSTKNSGM